MLAEAHGGIDDRFDPMAFAVMGADVEVFFLEAAEQKPTDERNRHREGVEPLLRAHEFHPALRHPALAEEASSYALIRCAPTDA
jgi:hypothetical protein